MFVIRKLFIVFSSNGVVVVVVFVALMIVVVVLVFLFILHVGFSWQCAIAHAHTFLQFILIKWYPVNEFHGAYNWIENMSNVYNQKDCSIAWHVLRSNMFVILARRSKRTIKIKQQQKWIEKASLIHAYLTFDDVSQ